MKKKLQRVDFVTFVLIVLFVKRLCELNVKKFWGQSVPQKTTCFRANYFQKRKAKLLWREILVEAFFFRETGTQKTFPNSIYCDFSLAIMYIHFMVDHKICQNCFRRQRYQAFLKATFRS